MLGVPPNATTDTIRQAYRTLAKQYHPDSSSGAVAVARFQQINEAHRILTDTALRQQYDLLLLQVYRSQLARETTHRVADVIQSYTKSPTASSQQGNGYSSSARKKQHRREIGRAWLVIASVVIVFSGIIITASRYSIKPAPRLDLSYRGISVWPKALNGSMEIRSLNISHNELGELPKDIGTLGGLYMLNAGYNGLKTLPKAVFNLRELSGLHLEGNEIRELSPLIGGLEQLRVLNLKDNQLARLPPTLARLRQLETLDLRGNPIPADSVRALKLVLPKTEILYDP